MEIQFKNGLYFSILIYSVWLIGWAIKILFPGLIWNQLLVLWIAGWHLFDNYFYSATLKDL